MGDETIDPEKISLKKLVGILSLGQLWKVFGAIIFVIVGAYGFGVWVTNEFDLKNLSDENKIITKQNKQFALQIKYLEQSLSYLNARVKDKENSLNSNSEDVILAHKVYVNMLKDMYQCGDPNLQKKKGYEFDESVAGEHKILFENGKSYLIPRSIKGAFIDQLHC